jgi:Flp pilus assembly secretin CpaC
MTLIEGCRPAMGSARFILAFTLLLAAQAAPTKAAAADLGVVLDHARLLRLPERVATIVVGNPLIADAAVQSGGLMVITGKSYGVTNIIALDRTGAVLLEKTIEVVAPHEELTVVYRGSVRETYSCSPNCEPRIIPGDAEKFFESIVNQSTSRSGLASGNPPSKDK